MIHSISQLDMNGSYTYADYLMWEFEERLELIKGRIFGMSAPSRYHQEIGVNLTIILANHLFDTPCKVYPAPFDVRLTHTDHAKNKEITTVVQPDLCVICDRKKLDKKGCIGAPDIVVEILSPGNSRKEMKEKFAVYQESGVLEYWIISPIEKTVQVFRLNEQGIYIGLAPLVEGDMLVTPILPGLEIDLDLVFRD